jgi:hypothetical protein
MNCSHPRMTSRNILVAASRFPFMRNKRGKNDWHGLLRVSHNSWHGIASLY